MFVELLRVLERRRTCRAFASSIGPLCRYLLICSRAGTLLAAVWRRLFYAMHRGQMTLEDISAIEAFFQGRAGPWAESAHHITLIVSQCVAILVVFAGETLVVVCTISDRALFGPLRLMGEHMRF